MSNGTLSALLAGAESDGPAERRRHPRLPNPPLEVNTEGRLAVQDISRGGICLAAGQPLAVGSCWELILTDGILFFTQTMAAEVVWYRAGVAGLRWLDLDERQQQWLEERFRQWERERA
jgi:hypothetical protein